MSEEYQDGIPIVPIDYGPADGAALMKLVDRIAELESKVINLANKLDEHLKEPDAHHVAMLAKRAQDG